jgi:hypothetical protein
VIPCCEDQRSSEDPIGVPEQSYSYNGIMWAIFDNIRDAVHAHHRFAQNTALRPLIRMPGITVDFMSAEDAMKVSVSLFLCDIAPLIIAPKDMCFVQGVCEFLTRVVVTYTGEDEHADHLLVVEEEMEKIGPVLSCECKSSDQPWLEVRICCMFSMSVVTNA